MEGRALCAPVPRRLVKLVTAKVVASNGIPYENRRFRFFLNRWMLLLLLNANRKCLIILLRVNVRRNDVQKGY